MLLKIFVISSSCFKLSALFFLHSVSRYVKNNDEMKSIHGTHFSESDKLWNTEKNPVCLCFYMIFKIIL